MRSGGARARSAAATDAPLDSVASKLSGAFSRAVGQSFLKETIGNFIFRVVNDSNTSLEIDPNKLARKLPAGVTLEAQLEKNQAALLSQAQEVLNRITSESTLKNTPREIRAIAFFTADYARRYAPDRIVPLVGGFVMLRIFNPSLLTPENIKSAATQVKKNFVEML